MPTHGLSAVPPAQVDVSVLGVRSGGGDWQPLPDWARYTLEAGLAVGRFVNENSRCVHAIVVPTRDFAAAFCAVGAVLASYERESSASAEVRFQELGALPPGSLVTLRDGRDRRRLLTGRFVGVRKAYDGELRLRIEIGDLDAGGTRHQVPREEVWRVSELDQDDAAPPERKRARVLQAINSFAADVLFPLDVRRFTEPGNPGCLVVGSRQRMTDEAVQQGLMTKAANPRSRPPSGVLDDLLSLEKGGGRASRTAVLPVRSSKPPDFSGSSPPPVTVFDGANGYLKWRDRLRSSHAIVVLDRTEPRFDDAVAQLQRDYVQRSTDPIPWTPPPTPGGVEALYFSLKSS